MIHVEHHNKQYLPCWNFPRLRFQFPRASPSNLIYMAEVSFHSHICFGMMQWKVTAIDAFRSVRSALKSKHGLH